LGVDKIELSVVLNTMPVFERATLPAAVLPPMTLLFCRAATKLPS
jgi:hypothetical protein